MLPTRYLIKYNTEIFPVLMLILLQLFELRLVYVSVDREAEQ